jgi:hypothetical protein
MTDAVSMRSASPHAAVIARLDPLLSGLNLRAWHMPRMLLRFLYFPVSETLKIAEAVKVPERFIISCRHRPI